MQSVTEIVLILLALFPVAAGIGFLAAYVHRANLKRALRESGAVVADKDVEIERIHAKERAEARALYERLAREKLDVIKTALTMGYDKQELARLDARLEQLIGTDRLQGLLAEPAAPAAQPALPHLPPTDELLDTDLEREIEAQRGKPRQHEG